MQLLFAFTLINSVTAVCEGKQCCDGKGTRWIDNLKSCQIMMAEGHCGAGGCSPFHVAPAPEGELIYCCLRPHHEEPIEPVVPEQQVEVQTESKADGMCVGPDCCDPGTWYDNLPGCQAAQANGKCGGCDPFQENGIKYCCRKHWNEQKDQQPAVAEQQVDVQTDSKADGMCVGPDCCDPGTWYDNLPGCQAAQANGKCGGCDPFQENGIKYCCRKHWNEEKDQQPAVAEQQVDVQTDSKAAAVCEGKQCCDGKGTRWITDLKSCQIMMAEGHCGAGGCSAFHVVPNEENFYCCLRPHHEEPIEPAVPEQQVEVQTESKADTMCEGAKCCDGKHSEWWSDKAGCLAQQTEGKCGGCEPFHVDPNPETMYCCHKHWNDSVLI